MKRAKQGMAKFETLVGYGLGWAVAAVLLAGGGMNVESVSAEPEPPPKSPEASVATIELPADLKVDIVATEPLIKDPIAIAWAADGSLWVVEMADYPSGVNGEMKPGGRVRHLTDQDGDGRYDQGKLFLSEVNFPTGVMPWKEGVIVAAAPDIFYAEDTDGDGRADKREVLLTGFAEKNPQLRVNGLRWGLDNWVYCANGLRTTGEIRSVKTGDHVRLGKRDFRFNPDTGEIDPQSGMSQFGRNRDDWGNWFGVHNSYPLWHFVLKDHYLRRNPYLASPDPKEQLVLPRNPPVYPRSRLIERYDHPHRGSLFTSACSAMIYRDNLLFPLSEKHAFTCEPQHNLIHREVLEPAGVTFTAHQPEREKAQEFLASKDLWFRPVMIRTAPDGALWIVDMYRYQIEHPKWMPPKGKRELEPFLRSGEEYGRIYRISPKKRSLRTVPNLYRKTNSELAKRFDTANGWQRDKIQQLLIWRDATEVSEQLKEMARGHSNAKARLHALCTLDGLEMLDARLIRDALKDPHPALRRHAIRLSKTVAGKGSPIIEEVVELVNDPDATVRLQLACSLGEWSGEKAGQALAALAKGEIGSEYMQTAILSSIVPHFAKVANVVASQPPGHVSPLTASLLDMAWQKEAFSAMAHVLTSLMAPDKNGHYTPEQLSVVGDWRERLENQGLDLETVIEKAGNKVGLQLKKLPGLTSYARSILRDQKHSIEEQTTAMRVLGWYGPEHEQDAAVLMSILSEQRPIPVQIKAVQVLGGIDHPSIPERLLKGWSDYLAPVRTTVLNVLSQRTAWLKVLLDRLEQGRIARSSVDMTFRNRLRRHDAASIQKRAERLFGDRKPNEKEKIADFKEVIRKEGDAKRGKAVFRKNCASCHQVGDIGRQIGPNLLSLTDRSPEALLTSILQPNQSIAPQYRTYEVMTGNDRVLLGILTSETGNSLTIKTVDGEAHTVSRKHVESLRTLEWSLMPEGLEHAMNRQELADLIQFLRYPQEAENLTE